MHEHIIRIDTIFDFEKKDTLFDYGKQKKGGTRRNKMGRRDLYVTGINMVATTPQGMTDDVGTNGKG